MENTHAQTQASTATGDSSLPAQSASVITTTENTLSQVPQEIVFPDMIAAALLAEMDNKDAFDMAEVKEGLRSKLLTSYQDAYKDRSDNWKSLETKAPGSIAIAGIFIAAALAYIEKSTSPLTLIQQMLVGLALAALVVSVLLAVNALKIQETIPPPYGEFVKINVYYFLDIEDAAELKERVEYFDYDLMSEWKKVVDKLDELIARKVECVYNAQAALVFAVVTVAILVLMKVFR